MAPDEANMDADKKPYANQFDNMVEGAAI